jgi:hypothetical protein
MLGKTLAGRFCGASFCTCYPEASYASGTSVFSLIAFASLASRYADNCWVSVALCREKSEPTKSIPTVPRFGIAPAAAHR